MVVALFSLALAGASLLGGVYGYRIPARISRQAADTYTNPIIPGNWADPWVFQWNDMYYLVPTSGSADVIVIPSKTLDSFDASAGTVVWSTNWTGNFWAPELHQIDGEFYIYGASQDGDLDSDRRTHVLKGTDPNDPTAPFEDLGVISTPDLNYMIDSTVLQNYNGKNYMIWSGKESTEADTVQYLYITEMSSPTTLVGERTMIHSPYWPDGSRKDWQWSPSSTDYGVNEGPEILQHGDKTFVVYSACGSWDACYSLAIMGLNGTDLDPLDPNAWWAKDDGPVFTQDDVTVGTGHASFPVDADGVPYVTFHGWNATASAGWGSRTVYTQAFTFNDDDTPNFGQPVGAGVALPAAAGYA
ncbi:unnamed protein product [Peniophora sp. CBMAI 1063]|nr:unnamed protein product [Peniophora sp. CBMAI 1063]